MACDCGPQYIQLWNYDDVQILESLSIDKDCQVVEGMGGKAIAIEEPKENNKLLRKNPLNPWLETLQLKLLTTYYQEFKAYSRGRIM